MLNTARIVALTLLAQWADACPVDERTLVDLMSEVQDAALRQKVLRLCVQLAEVDANVDAGESIVLTTAVEQWGLQHEMLRPAWAPHERSMR